MLKLNVRNEVSAGVLENRFALLTKLIQWVIIFRRFDTNKYHNLKNQIKSFMEDISPVEDEDIKLPKISKSNY